MKKGQIIEGIVERVEFPNKGIVVTEDGERVIVKNAIPGQRVSAAVNKARKGKCEGRLLSVLERSPLELAEAGCIHAADCGGCTYQSLPYEEQLSMKAAQVKKLIDGVIVPENADYEFQGIKASPRQTAYRNKMEFSFGDEYKDGPLALGMHKRGSFYDIVNVPECRIVDEDFRTVLSVTLAYFRERNISYYHKLRHTGYLRHLLVRKAVKTGEILVDLVTTTQIPRPTKSVSGGKVVFVPEGRSACGLEQECFAVPGAMPGDGVSAERTGSGLEQEAVAVPGVMPGDGVLAEEEVPAERTGSVSERELLAGWKDALLAASYTGKLAGILHTKNDSVADTISNEGTDILFGQDYFYEELLGLRFKITPFSFFQTNSLGAEVLYETAREFIGDALTADRQPNGTKADALADEQEVAKDGGGRIVFDLYSGTGTIAQMLSPVAKKVIGVEIVEEAVEAARENAELNGLHNCEFIAGDVLKVIDEIEEKPDYIVLDPPRDGIHPKALEKIIRYGVSQMVYISCKPTSLARDLEVLQARGYEVKKVCCVDMFPASCHVETVCLLTQNLV